MDAINTIEDDTVRRELHYCVQKCEYWSGYSIRTDSIAHAIFDMIQIKKIKLIEIIPILLIVFA